MEAGIMLNILVVDDEQAITDLIESNHYKSACRVKAEKQFLT